MGRVDLISSEISSRPWQPLINEEHISNPGTVTLT